jgi:dipeptidyl aminopeptidase/acylaminoacyl peptidase
VNGPVGLILSFRRLKRRRFSGWISVPAVVAAGGGRFARATYPRRYDEASWPAWSPDGKEIAYVRGSSSDCGSVAGGCFGGEVWLVNPDGTGRHLIAAHGIAPAWSPDGTKLAYGVPGDKIVIANADGSDPQVVTSGTKPAWSPDGHELAVQDRDSIWVLSTDGTNRHRVLRNAETPDWSPDGSQLVFTHACTSASSCDTLMVANADGSNAHSLGVQNLVLKAAWSPDGREIAYGSTGDGLSFDSSDVCEIRPDGTGKHCLRLAGSAAPISDIFWAGDPSWGPAPGQLVFSEWDGQADADFHLVTWPGGRQITAASPEVIRVYTSTGRKVAETDAGGTLLALAVSKRVLAGLIRDPLGGWSVKIYQPRPRTVRLPGRPRAFLSAAGTTLVFQVGRSIDTLNALRGSPHAVATTSTHAASVSIFGRRIAWTDHHQIRILNLGR